MAGPLVQTTTQCPPVSPRLAHHLSTSPTRTPVLVLDRSVVAAKLAELRAALPEADVFYAVKANPLPDLVRLLAAAGAGFDVASAAEVQLCLDAGVPPSRLSFGNTIKRATDIAAAYRHGLETFAVDSVEELAKVARHAPGARVFVRLMTSGSHAQWPLSRKFGCAPEAALALLRAAPAVGLRPEGLAFHVGSQQTDPSAWDAPIATCAEIRRHLRRDGIDLPVLNLGGGLPATYASPVPPLQAYVDAIRGSIARHFGGDRPRLVIEPGRSLVAEAGVIQTEVLLVSRVGAREPRWVYIDCGKFGGLAETMDEAIRYALWTDAPGPLVPAVLAGPTCDSADVLYERTPVWLPSGLREGDRLLVLAAGAYTYPYASVGFNGLAPLQVIGL